MLKYIGVLMLVLLAMGATSAQPPVYCDVCYANIITQTDTQTIENVKLGMSSADPHVEQTAVVNEGLSAGIIVTPKWADPANDSMFAVAGFARIDQAMTQTIDTLGTLDPVNGEEGAKGLTLNKAIQAAWIANQGLKENDTGIWVHEGAYVGQTTDQTIFNVYDYDSRERANIMNLDNKVALIVDDLNAVINLTANADSTTVDNATSSGNFYDDINIVENSTVR
jgi:hypothetical protein